MQLLLVMRVAFAACLLAIASLSFSQQAPSKQASTTFRGSSNLVLVPVVVTDDSGKYVRNLRQEDFLVRENGKEQKVAIFEPMLAASSPAPKRPEQDATELTNAFVGQTRPGHLIILVLDTVSTSMDDQAYARDELIKFVQTAQPNAPMALASLRRTEIRLLHDFTTEPKELIAAIQKETGTQPVVLKRDLEEVDKLRGELEQAEACSMIRAESQAVEGCHNPSHEEPMAAWKQKARELKNYLDAAQSHVGQLQKAAILETLDGLQQLAHAFAGVPGRKSLIWASAGFPFSAGAAELAVRPEWFANQGMLELYPWYERTWQVLNDANTVLYPVDARGLSNPLYHSPTNPRLPTREAVEQAVARHDDTIATMQIFGRMTGGMAFYNRNDLDAAFAGATEDTASYYLLGYYLGPGGKAGWRKLQVEVKARGLRIRSRSGFFVEDKFFNPEASRNSDIELALRSPLDYSGVKLQVGVRNTEDMGARKRVTFRIKVKDTGILDTTNENRYILQFTGAAITGEGQVAAKFSNIFEGKLAPEKTASVSDAGLYYDIPLELAPGQYRVRFVVRDNIRGVMGSVSGPFAVQ